MLKILSLQRIFPAVDRVCERNAHGMLVRSDNCLKMNNAVISPGMVKRRFSGLIPNSRKGCAGIKTIAFLMILLPCGCSTTPDIQTMTGETNRERIKMDFDWKFSLGVTVEYFLRAISAKSAATERLLK